jgi:hypothetical protein
VSSDNLFCLTGSLRFLVLGGSGSRAIGLRAGMRVTLRHMMLVAAVVIVVVAAAVSGWLWAIMMWYVGPIMLLRSRSVVLSCIRHYKCQHHGFISSQISRDVTHLVRRLALARKLVGCIEC